MRAVSLASNYFHQLIAGSSLLYKSRGVKAPMWVGSKFSSILRPQTGPHGKGRPDHAEIIITLDLINALRQTLEFVRSIDGARATERDLI